MQHGGRGAHSGRGVRGGMSAFAPRDRTRATQRVEEKPDNSPIGGVIGSIVRLGDIVISSNPQNATKETYLVPVLLPTDTSVYSQVPLSLDEQLRRTTSALSLTLERDFTLFTDTILACVVALPTKTLVYTALIAQLTAADRQFGAYFVAQLGKRVSQAANTLAAAYAPTSLKGLPLPAPADAAPAAAPAAAATVSALISSGFGSPAPTSPSDARLRLRLLVRLLLCLVGAGVVTAEPAAETLRRLLVDSGVAAVAAALAEGGADALLPLPHCAPSSVAAPAADPASAAPASAAPAAPATVPLPSGCAGVCVPLADAAAEAVLDALAHAAPLLQRPSASPAPAPAAAPAVVPVLLPLLEAWGTARAAVAAAAPRASAWVRGSAETPAEAEQDEYITLLMALLDRAPAPAEAQGVAALVPAFSVLSPSPAAYSALVTAGQPALSVDPWDLASWLSASARAAAPVAAAARLAAATATTAAPGASPVAAAPASARAALVGPLPLARVPLPAAEALAALEAGARPIDKALLLRAAADTVVTFNGLKEEAALALLTLPPLVAPATAAGSPSAGAGAEPATDSAPAPATDPVFGSGSGSVSVSSTDAIYSSAVWGASLVPFASESPLHLVTDTLISLALAPGRAPCPAPAAVERLLIDLLQLQRASLPARLGPRLFSLFARCGALTPAASARLAAYHAFHFTNLGFGWPWEAWRAALEEPLAGPRSIFVRSVIESMVRLTFYDLAAHNVPPPFHSLFPARPDPFDFLAMAQTVVSSTAGANPALPAPAASMIEASAALAAAVEAAVARKATAADVARLAESFAAQPVPGTLGAGTAPATDPAIAASHSRARAARLLSECCFLGVWPSLRAAESQRFAPGAGTDALHPALLGVVAAVLRRGRATYTHAQAMIDRLWPALEVVLSPPTAAPAVGGDGLPDAGTASVSVAEATGATVLLPSAPQWALLDSYALFWRASRQHAEVLLPRLLRAGLVTPESAASWLLGPAPGAGVFPWGPLDPALWATLHAVIRLALADLDAAATKVRVAASGPRAASLAPQLAAAARKVLVRQGQFLSGVMAALATLERRAPELATMMATAQGQRPDGVPPPASADQIAKRIHAAGREIIEVFGNSFADAAAYLSPDVAAHFEDNLRWIFAV